MTADVMARRLSTISSSTHESTATCFLLRVSSLWLTMPFGPSSVTDAREERARSLKRLTVAATERVSPLAAAAAAEDDDAGAAVALESSASESERCEAVAEGMPGSMGSCRGDGNSDDGSSCDADAVAKAAPPRRRRRSKAACVAVDVASMVEAGSGPATRTHTMHGDARDTATTADGAEGDVVQHGRRFTAESARTAGMPRASERAMERERTVSEEERRGRSLTRTQKLVHRCGSRRLGSRGVESSISRASTRGTTQPTNDTARETQRRRAGGCSAEEKREQQQRRGERGASEAERETAKTQSANIVGVSFAVSLAGADFIDVDGKYLSCSLEPRIDGEQDLDLD